MKTLYGITNENKEIYIDREQINKSMIIVGDCGSGKTIAIKKEIRQLLNNNKTVLYISDFNEKALECFSYDSNLICFFVRNFKYDYKKMIYYITNIVDKSQNIYLYFDDCFCFDDKDFVDIFLPFFKKYRNKIIITISLLICINNKQKELIEYICPNSIYQIFKTNENLNLLIRNIISTSDIKKLNKYESFIVFNKKNYYKINGGFF